MKKRKKLQENIREEGGRRWSEHTKTLPELKIGQWVQLQNLKGNHPLKSDYSGQIVGRHNLNSYAVKVNNTGRITMRNRDSLRKIPQPTLIQQPLNLPRQLQGPGSSELSGSQQGVASGSQETGSR